MALVKLSLSASLAWPPAFLVVRHCLLQKGPIITKLFLFYLSIFFSFNFFVNAFPSILPMNEQVNKTSRFS
ncbi:Os07g0132400 [Oryza sativa Japonica Group]|uniref:Os07g0132400 protein n=1 Tax=Oryza sativa subsp. japonica TaxID=39947 RepID=A0A0P0X2E7_ORYSJ|nr:Os07g0132400 [Oryza sativa Japonica Group]